MSPNVCLPTALRLCLKNPQETEFLDFHLGVFVLPRTHSNSVTHRRGGVASPVLIFPQRRRLPSIHVFTEYNSRKATPCNSRLPKAINSLYLIKFVQIFFSFSGASPAALPASIHFISQAIFLPRIRIVCKPSASCKACSGVLPWISFQ